MVQGCALKVYCKVGSDKGLLLASHTDDKYGVIAQWLLARRSKVRSKYFVALFNQNNECIDAKYVSHTAALEMLTTCNGVR